MKSDKEIKERKKRIGKENRDRRGERVRKGVRWRLIKS